MELRPYQIEAIQSVRAEYKKGFSRPVLCLPTGAGKTFIASEVIKRALDRGAHRVAFMIDSLTLVDQTIKAFAEVGLDVGVIQGIHEKTDISKRCQIITPQTIKRRFSGKNADKFGKLYRVDLMIVDEAHIMHTGVQEAVEHWGCPVLALTATPYTKGMGKFYDSVVFPIRMDSLIDEGYLSKYRVYSHNAPDMKGVKVVAGDYVASQAAEKYDTGLIADVVGTWLKYGKGRKTLGFASTVANAKRFSEMFVAAGIRSEYTSGYLDSEDAIERLRGFQEGDTEVLWNVQKLTKGFDYPLASCLIDCAPTKSLSLHIQKGGRVLRTHPDKEYALILDHSGNYLRNGFLEDASCEKLDDGSNKNDKAKKEKLPKPCPKCSYMKITQICPMCGFITEPQSTIEVEEGELKLLTKTQKKRNKDISWEEKQLFVSELMRHAHNRGFKAGWIYPNYKAYMGVLPFDSRLKGLRMADTIRESTQNWIKSQQIRYAKRKGI